MVRKFRKGGVKKLGHDGLRFFGISHDKDVEYQSRISGAWSHAEFYRLAAQTRMPECDVFLMNNEKLVVPATNFLFELTAE